MLLFLSILLYFLDFLLLKVVLESLDLSVAISLLFLEDEDLLFEKILLFLLLLKNPTGHFLSLLPENSVWFSDVPGGGERGY